MVLQQLIKRLFDIICSLLLLIGFLPVWLLVALVIKLTSPGPVFFLQVRPGYHKQLFKVYKFRTMRLGSEKMVKGQEVMQDDVRITPCGRFLRRTKIDEIPQIINVIKGDMSLVGPRPERVESLEDYDNEISKRLDVLPGMTGLAQVSGNIYLDLQDRYVLDVYYAEHFSLWLDVKILLRTVGVILRGEAYYQDFPLVQLPERTTEKELITK